MVKMVVYCKVNTGKIRLSEREQLFILEIGKDIINSASSFVNYVSEIYGIAKSSSWYCLKRMKDLQLLHFDSKLEHMQKGLFLTSTGKEVLQSLNRNVKLNEHNRFTLIEERMHLFG